MIKKSSKEVYRNAFAVYLHLAADNVVQWLNLNVADGKDSIERLKGESLLESKAQFWSAARKNIYFIEWAARNGRYFLPDIVEGKTTGEIEQENYSKLVEWIELLFDIRNYWSHTKHDSILLPVEINDILLEFYLQACASAKGIIPDRYKGSEGLNYCKKEKTKDDEGKDVYNLMNITTELSTTGYIFFASLFLDGQQINRFLEDMEQSAYCFEILGKRSEYRLLNPGKPYPPELTTDKKQFLYARDVYTYWRVRGHRDNIIEEHSLDDKEEYYSMLEYLKRCPKERLELVGVELTEKNDKNRAIKKTEFSIADETYDIREKDKFMEFTLEFWDEEMSRLDLADWSWAHHQSADEKHKIKLELETQAHENGRPYRFPRYKKVIFDLPQDEDALLNYRNDEHGFPYYLLKDESDTFVQAMFRFRHLNGKTVIGLMGSRLLCSVMEYYLWRFSVTDQSPETDKKRHNFWNKFFKACFIHIAEFKRTEKQKLVVTREQVENRIDLLTERYEAITGNEEISTHRKITFILQTWNQIVSYGRTTNLEHAIDSKGIIGGKNGYQELMRYLTLLDNDILDKGKQAHESLMRLLSQLGTLKSKESYFSVINKAFQSAKICNSPFALKKHETLDEQFKLCALYRKATLANFHAKLNDFRPEDWRPAYEMRWLGLRDGRTIEASQQTKPSGQRETPPTLIVNIDNKQYSAVGLPRDIRHFTDIVFRKNIDADGLEKVHANIYPSPNGCTLLIPDFYTRDGVELGDIRGNQHVRKRLFLIRRQDTVLSHLAYLKGVKFEKKPLNGIELKNTNFQETEMLLPVKRGEETILNIQFFYRYFKQNRYQLPMQLTRQLCELLVERELMKIGEEIKFNRLQLVLKETMNYNEREELLSNEEKKMSHAEKQKLVEERFARIKPMIFKPSGDNSQFYMSELLDSYTICRRVMVEKLFQLELKTLELYPHIAEHKTGYISFANILDCLSENGILINVTEKDKLKRIRNAAFHCKLPETDCLPIELLKQIKDVNARKEAKYFLDVFGTGLEITNRIVSIINEKLPPKAGIRKEHAYATYKKSNR